MKFYNSIILVTMVVKMYTCTPTGPGLFYVLPDDSPVSDVSCPSQPCDSLSQYLLNMPVLSMSNVKFMFLSGTHSLTSNITLQHVHNVTMAGVAHYDSVLPIIFCHSTEAIMIFVNSSNITITNLLFENCRGTGPKIFDGSFDRPVMTAVYFATCYYCNVSNVTFKGYGLIINNLLGESYLDNITLYLNKINKKLKI